MESVLLDLRHTLRGLRRAPGLTVAVLVTLTLGIGANAAIFSVLNAVLLKPLPFPDDERLVRIYTVRGGQPPYISLQPDTFLEVEQQARSFASLAGQRLETLGLTTPDGPLAVDAMGVTAGWKETVGVQPMLGRVFTTEDSEAGRDSSAVLVSDAFWSRHFGRAPDVIGREILLGDRKHVVIGVMPAGFQYPYGVDLWKPMNLRRDGIGRWGLNAPARLAPGVTLEAARAELEALTGRLAELQPDRWRGVQLTARPLRLTLLGDHSHASAALLGVTGLMLLIACANVASLLLARAVARRREMAVRAALGASRLRQTRQLMTESLFLALLGGAGGLGLAALMQPFLGQMLPEDLGSLIGTVPLDGRVLGFTVGISVGAALVFGLLPAVRSSGTDLRGILAAGGAAGTSGGRHRLMGALASIEIALAVVLLVAAAAMVQGLLKMTRADLGYDARGLVAMSLTLNRERDAEQRNRFVDRVVERLGELTWVQGAGVTSIFPSRNGNFLARIEVEGWSVNPEEATLVNQRLISPGFLPTLGVPVLRGRGLSDVDRADSPRVVLINDSMARRLWPGEDPLGRRLKSLRTGESPDWLTVVGVVADLNEQQDEVVETVYLAYAQNAAAPQASGIVFTVRAAHSELSGDAALPDGFVGELRRAVASVDASVPIEEVHRVTELHAEALATERFGTTLASVFAVVGILLAGVGIHGVLAYDVRLRRRELGIRMALGASSRRILREVLGRGLLLIGLGGSVGLAAAKALGPLLTSVYPETATAATPLAVALGALATVAVAACLVPALRAARVPITEVLRTE